ncbi:hypothetical protein F5148DRAFT_492731 [Russula earlei]|uniref:Uncharacterized protein n=1 Tax=Russula earlei TaxID=71964 RepID=A0ACC0UI29_9AGAM|nr:hypothetical protein F5148DRAFT_492731 [Russula earlei]
MSQNTNDVPRKPPGPSSLSGTHSPLDAPVNSQSQRRLAHPTANSTFAVGVGTPGTLANSSLSSGWQVWGSAAASPQRNVSASSAPATTDPLSSQGEMPFRSNVTEGWRSSSGTWGDDDAGEYALVSHHSKRGRQNCWPRVGFRGTLTPLLGPAKAGQRRARSHLLTSHRRPASRRTQTFILSSTF